jgi:serine protease Do
MLRRLMFIIALTAALGVGAAIASQSSQSKSKSKEQTETKKDKPLFEASPGASWFELAGGEGAYLGVYLEEVTPERTKELGLKEERGAIVMKVVEDSPAQKSGLKENDVIVSFNGRRVDSVRELQRLLGETPAERTIQIEVVRGGSHQTLTTNLAKRSQKSFFDDRFFKQNEEAAKRSEEAMKRSEEALKRSLERSDELKSAQERLRTLPPDFGNFSFVNPGEFSFFAGTRLGISAESLTDQLAEFFGVKDGKGVLVASVEDNSAAAKAGIKAGDVITSIDDQRVDSVSALLKALSAKKEGTLTVTIVRNHSEQTLNVTIEKRESPVPRRRAVAYRKAAAAV